MNLRSRVYILEKWMDKAEKIQSLYDRVTQLQNELKAVESYLGIKVSYGPVATINTIEMNKEEKNANR